MMKGGEGSNWDKWCFKEPATWILAWPSPRPCLTLSRAGPGSTCHAGGREVEGAFAREAFNRSRSPGARAWWGARAEPWAPMVVGAGGIRYLADSYLPNTAGRSQEQTLPSHKTHRTSVEIYMIMVFRSKVNMHKNSNVQSIIK